MRIWGMMFAAVAVWGWSTAPLPAAELVYFGSPACSVCETWDREVGAIYPKTDEAGQLPLRYQNVHDGKPKDLAFIKGVVYTPTFVAVENGREVGRIVGYMGDFFFWEQVDGLIKKLAPQKAMGRESACSTGAPSSPQSSSQKSKC